MDRRLEHGQQFGRQGSRRGLRAVQEEEQDALVTRPRTMGAKEALDRRWRTGRKIGRTLHAQVGAQSSDDDPVLGMMDSIALAARVVSDHNIILAQRSEAARIREEAKR